MKVAASTHVVVGRGQPSGEDSARSTTDDEHKHATKENLPSHRGCALASTHTCPPNSSGGSSSKVLDLRAHRSESRLPETSRSKHNESEHDAP